jgi:hypothetical protein
LLSTSVKIVGWTKKPEGSQDRLLGRFDHCRVAEREHWGQLPGGKKQRVVAGGQQTAHAQRSPRREREGRTAHGVHVSVDLGRPTSEVVERGCRDRYFPACIGQWLLCVDRLQLGKLLAVGLDQVSDAT